jgi:hypothetical protein
MKLNIGCGKNVKEGFINVDAIAFEGVDVVMDVRQAWPWDHNSVDEVYCAHFLEHLTGVERCHFANELCRVLKPKAQATLIVPSWTSARAYGDPTHQWPPVTEMWFYYLGKEWRDKQAPHTNKSNWAQGFDCDFDATWGYGMHEQLLARNDDFRQFALQWYKEAAQDIHITLTKR